SEARVMSSWVSWPVLGSEVAAVKNPALGEGYAGGSSLRNRRGCLRGGGGACFCYFSFGPTITGRTRQIPGDARQLHRLPHAGILLWKAGHGPLPRRVGGWVRNSRTRRLPRPQSDA